MQNKLTHMAAFCHAQQSLSFKTHRQLTAVHEQLAAHREGCKFAFQLLLHPPGGPYQGSADANSTLSVTISQPAPHLRLMRHRKNRAKPVPSSLACSQLNQFSSSS